MAAAFERPTAETASAWSKPSRVAGVDVFSDLARVETIWRGLEDRQNVSTPFQRFDFLSAWQRQAGERQNVQPFIVVAHDEEHRPLMLLPLALRHEHAVRTASFMGGKHSTFNMPLWDGGFVAGITAADIDALIAALRTRSEADILTLHQQPMRWRDLSNPMAMLPHQASVNDCPLMTVAPGAALSTGVSNSIRRRLRAKERKLQTLPGYRYGVASTDSQIVRLLDAFFRVKPLRMAEQKLPNVFAATGVEEFIRDACLMPTTGGGHVIDMHALECDAEVIAIFAGVADGNRFSMMFNTYAMSENSRFSPGLILLRHITDHYARLGYRALDLGAGSDEYKRLFCKSDEPMFDCFIPLTSRGTLAATAMSGVNRAKHLVKHNPALLQMAKRMRSAFL